MRLPRLIVAACYGLSGLTHGHRIGLGHVAASTACAAAPSCHPRLPSYLRCTTAHCCSTPVHSASSSDGEAAGPEGEGGGRSAQTLLSLNTALDFSQPYRILAFYALAPIAAPDERVAAHRAFLAARHMVGRVYICAEGLNAQVSGTPAACAEYRDFAASDFWVTVTRADLAAEREP